MMRIRYIKIILMTFGTSFLLSCQKQLDLEPRQSVDIEVALADMNAVNNAIVGCYDGIQDSDVLGANVVQNAELQAGMINWQGSFTSYTDMASRNMQTDNTEATALWVDGFAAIDAANRVLDAIDNGSIADPDEDALNIIKGEALFIRAIIYSELISYFAQPYGFTPDNSHLGVPLVTSPAKNVEELKKDVARATVAEIYAQIIEDLIMAETLLPISNTGRASVYSAKGLLARVYLQQKDWGSAAAKAQEVISGGFELLPDINGFYSSANSSESIFEVQHTSSDNLSNANAGLNDYWNPDQRGDINIPLAVIDMYENTDKRKAWFYEKVGAYWSSKYTKDDNNVIIMRLSEMLLSRAEALVETSNSINDANAIEALSLVNQIRSRAGLDDAAMPVDLVLLKEIVKSEWILEMMHEGHLIRNYKRWEEPAIGSSVGLGTVAWDNPRLVFPIPQTEMDVNELLVQNEGY